MKKVLLLISTLLLTVLLISCKTKVYTVTFNSDGGSSVEKQEVKKGDLATKPSNPTKDNYDFQVWVDEDNKEWIFATRKVEKDVTLKATWKEKTPVIEKFKLTLSEGLSSNQANNNEIAKGTAVTITVTVPADKQIKTFTVNGEDKKNSIGINNQFKFNIMANTTIVLVLEDKTTPVEKVTVEFILGFEGTAIPNQEINKGAKATKPTNPVREGYNFLGWTTVENGTALFNFDTAVNANQKLYAKWEIKTFVVTVDLKNGTTPTTRTVNWNETLTLTEPTREGYTFVKWVSNGIEFNPTTPIKEALTVEATWEVVQYTITYVLNDGTNHTENPLTYTIENNTIILQSPTREGYIFNGWYEGEEKVEQIEVSRLENITLEARWTEREPDVTYYAVNFDYNNGTSILTREVKEGETATKPVNPTKEGHTFVEWQLNGVEYDFATPVTAELTLIAKWEINTFEVTIDLKNGTNPTTQTVNWNETVTLETPTRTGYTFVKWLSNGTDFTAETPITAETLVEAVWEATEYTITYDLNEGTNHTGNPHKYTIENDTIVLQIPTREGYIFNGWYEGETKVTQIETTRLENITLEARWTEKEPGVTYYEVVFDSQEGSTVSTQEVKAGETATKPVNPTKEGHTFVEWLLDGAAYNFTTPVTEELTLVAKWKINTFEITIDLDYEGAELTTQNVNWNEKVTLTEPTRESHDFIGWFVGEEPFDVNTLVTEEFIITAKWQLKTFEVTVDLNNNTPTTTQTVNWGERPTLQGENDVTKEGYVFYHWYVGDTRDNGNLLVKSEMTFKLKWARAAATAEGLKEALKPENLEADVPILITAPIVLDEPLTLPAGALLDGGGQTISFGSQTEPVEPESRQTVFKNNSMLLRSLRLNTEIETGLLIESDGSQLVNTTISGATGYGVTVKNAKNVLIEDIEIVNSGKGAILVTGSVVTIKDVTMTGNTKNIIVESGVDTPVVTTEGVLATNNDQALIVVEQDVQSIEGWFITNLFAIRKENETRIQFVSELNETLGQAYTLNNGINYIVQDYKTLLNDTIVDNITLLESITLTEQLVIRRELTLDGNNKTLTLNNTDGWNAEYVIQVYNAVGVVIKNITLKGGDAALLVNASEVEVENIVLDTHEFGGIELAKGENPKNNPTLVVNGLTYTNINENLPVIWVDELASNEYEVTGHQLKEYNHPTKNQVWYVVQSYDTDAPEVEVKTIVNKDGTIVITIEANDENLHSLEIDHNFEGLLPEFTVYASEGNPYGTDEQKAIFVTYGVTVIFAEGKWTITIDGSSYKQLITSDKTEFVVYFVIADKNGNKFGSMSPTTGENTITVSLEEVGVENEEELRLAITNQKVKVINLVSDIELETSLLVTRPVEINGNGNTLSLPTSTTWKAGNYVIQAFKTIGVVIKNITLAGGNAGLLVNGSEVEVENVIVKDNSFGGIEVSKGKNVTTKPILTVNGLTYVTADNLPVIWVDKLTSGEYEVVGSNLSSYKPVGKDQVWYVEASRVPMTVEENIEAALDYTYEGYQYTGTFELNGTEILATYNEIVAAKLIMDDLARYLGALYRVDGSVVREITFNQVKYTWNESKGLKGSNWYNGETSLVSAVSQQFLLNPNKLSYEFELSDGENLQTLTLKVAEATKVSVEVENELELRVALGNSRVVEINLTENINLATSLLVTRPVTINGNGNTLSLPTSTTWTAGNYVIQAFKATGVVIKDITLAGGNAGLLVNGSEVTVEDVKVTNNSFGGIEVSKGKNVTTAPRLTVNGLTYVTTNNLPVIWVDGTNENWVESNLTATTYTKANGDKQVWFGLEAYVFETVNVTTKEELVAAVANQNVKVINILNDILLTVTEYNRTNAGLLINRPVKVNGNGYTLSLATQTTWQNPGHYVIHVYNTTDVLLENVKLAGGNVGLLVNGAGVSVDKVTVSGNEFGGIEVAQGSVAPKAPKLTVLGTVTFDKANLPVIWVDGIEASWVESNLITTIYTKANGEKQVWFGPEAYVFKAVYVTTVDELIAAVENTYVEVINLVNDIELATSLLVTRTVVINGNGNTLSLPTSTTWKAGNYVIQAFKTTGVVIKNITLAGGNAGLLVNGSEVEVENVIVNDNSFGGVEVSKGKNVTSTPRLTVNGLTYETTNNLPVIWIDGTDANWVDYTGSVATTYTKENGDKQIWFGPEAYVFKTVNVTTADELIAAVENTYVEVINLVSNIELRPETYPTTKAGLLITRPLTINGNGKELSIMSDAGWQANYIIQIFGTNGVVLENITFNGGDAALLVNGSEVKLENITLVNQEFGGIEVKVLRGIEPKLTINELKYDSKELPTIWFDGITTEINVVELIKIKLVAANGKDQVWFVNNDFVQTKAYVRNEEELRAALTKDSIKEIILINDIDLVKGILIEKTIILNGNGKQITFKNLNNTGIADYLRHGVIVGLNVSDVVIKNITIDGYKDGYGILVHGGANVLIQGVTVKNSSKGGIQVNGSKVIVEDLTLENNEWGGIQVVAFENHTPELVLKGDISNNQSTKPVIWLETENGAGWVIQDSEILKIFNGHGKKQIWYINDTFDLESPVFVSKEMKNDEATIVLIIEATDENLYSLEIDHNLEGKLPEFTVYASKDNPYGTEEQRDAFESYNVSVEYENGKWIIIFSGKSYETILKEHNGKFVVHFVIGDANGNKFGSMSPTTSENTIILSLEEVQVKTEEELRLAVANPKVKVINILNDITLSETSSRVKSGLVISRPLTINGNEKVLSMESEDGWQGNYIIQVIRTENVKLNNIKFNGGDAAILVNGAVVEVENIVLGSHEFGGIEVSKGETSNLLTPKLTVSGLKVEGLLETLPIIWVDGTEASWVSSNLKSAEYVTEKGKDQVWFNEKGFVFDHVNVRNEAELRLAVANPKVKVINILNDITLSETSSRVKSGLVISRPLTINGNGKVLSMASVTGWQGNYIIQVIRTENVKLSNIEFNGGDAAILVNGAIVEVEDIVLGNHEFGGIEVSKGETSNLLTPKLTVSGLEVEGLSATLPTIWIDGKHTNDGWVENVQSLSEVQYVKEDGTRQLLFVDSKVVATVTTAEELRTAVSDLTKMIIILSNDIVLNSNLDIKRSLILNGNNKTIKFENVEIENKHGIIISSNNVIITELTVDGYSKGYGIQAYNKESIILDKVTVNNSSKGGILVNNAVVVVKDVTLENNAWGGIEVSKGKTGTLEPKLTVLGNITYIIGNSGKTAIIWIDGETSNNGWVIQSGLKETIQENQLWFESSIAVIDVLDVRTQSNLPRLHLGFKLTSDFDLDNLNNDIEVAYYTIFNGEKISIKNNGLDLIKNKNWAGFLLNGSTKYVKGLEGTSDYTETNSNLLPEDILLATQLRNGQSSDGSNMEYHDIDWNKSYTFYVEVRLVSGNVTTIASSTYTYNK